MSISDAMQVKILKAVTKAGGSKSRGTAFVEFTEHQHALVALRVLNNNPGIEVWNFRMILGSY